MIRFSTIVLAVCMIVGAAFGQAPQGKFILLLHETSKFRNLPDREAQINEYRQWAEKLGAAGQLVDAAKLKDDGMMVGSGTPRKVTPAELPQTGNGVAGYFVIRAAGYEDAVKVALTCPHVKYGGQIVVRQLEEGK